MSDRPAIEDVVAAAERVIREELAGLVSSGANWKLIFSGSAGGTVVYSTEQHRRLSTAREIVKA